MAIQLDHVIVPSRQRAVSAKLLADLLGVPWEKSRGEFTPVYVASISAIRVREIPNADDLFLVTHVAIADLQPIANLGLIIGFLLWRAQWIKAKAELFDALLFRTLQFASFWFGNLIEVVDPIINSPLLRAWRGIHSFTEVPNICVVSLVEADIVFRLNDSGCRSYFLRFI